MATKEDCIKAAVGSGISKEDAALLVGEIAREREALLASGHTGDMNRTLARLFMDKAGAARAKATAGRHRAALNIVAHNRVQTFVNSVKAEGGDTVDALEALLVGSGKRFTGSRESVSRLGASLKALWGGSMANDLDRAGVLPLLMKDHDFSDAVMREMISPQSTGNKLARQTADIFNRYLEHMRRQLNDAGADIGKPDNDAPQSHDTIKLRRFGEDGWIKYISERLDWERTFPELSTDKERLHALGEVYQNIITGVGRKQGEKVRTSVFTPPRNPAASPGKERVLHFKDADAAVEYNRRFGSGNIVQAVIGKMEVYSRRLALMQTFGPNPEGMIRRFLDREAQGLRDAHRDPSRILAAWQDEKRGKLAHYYRVLSGEAGTPENLTAARIAAGARAVMGMAKLGGALLSSFADIGVKTQAAIHAGEGWLPAWKTGLEMRFERFQSAERRELGHSLGVYTQGLLAELYSKFDVNDALSGTMTRWMNSFFRMSGLTAWTEAHRAAYTYHLSNRLARQLERGGAELLDSNYAAVLRKNGLLDRWDLLGKMVEEVDGEKYVIPENAAGLTDEDLAAHLPEHLREENAPAGVDAGVNLEARAPVVIAIPRFARGMSLTEARALLNREVKPRILAEFAGNEGVRHPFFGDRPINMSATDFKEHLRKESKGLADPWPQLEAVAALPELMRSAQWVASHGDVKPTQARAIKQIHRFIAALRLEETDYAVTLTVKEFAEGKLGLDFPEVLKFYHHRVEKELPADFSRKSRWVGTSGPTAGTAPLSSQVKADDATKLQRPIETDALPTLWQGGEKSNGQETYTLRQLLSGVKNVEGKPYLTGEGDHAQWQAARAAELDRMRRKLAQDVMGYFADETGYAVLEPDARTRAAMYGSTKPGSLAGEMLRFAWQFKSFPVTYWQRIIRESRWQRASRQPEGGFASWHDPRRTSADVPAFIHFFLAATALGYVSLAAKDLSRGRTPRDITANPSRVALAAIMQGGGLGLLGDFFLGTADRFGNQLASNLLGPVPSELTNLGVMTAQLARGGLDQAGETAVRTLSNNTPYVNLWYTRAAMDYLVNFHLREMMSPGTLARSERKMKEEMNQTYFNFGGVDLTPSRVIRKGGGFR